MSMTPENPHIGKHDPQREADWNDGFEESRAHFTARIAELEAQLGITRMCVNCGKCKPASEPQHEPLPECVGEDGLSACTFDTTPQEAWEHWRKRARELEAENERLVAGLESVVRSMPPDEHGYVLPGRVQAELVLGGSKRPLERAQIQMADLEAQVRERDEALKAAREVLQNALRGHRYCEDGWYSCPKDEDGCLDPSAGSDCNCGADKTNASIAAALANPLIGGAK